MNTLILRPHKVFGEGHYEAVHEGQHVGPIYLSSRYSAGGESCTGALTGLLGKKQKGRAPARMGRHAESREAAMAVFRAAWDALCRPNNHGRCCEARDPASVVLRPTVFLQVSFPFRWAHRLRAVGGALSAIGLVGSPPGLAA